jgi:hypothetical protein
MAAWHLRDILGAMTPVGITLSRKRSISIKSKLIGNVSVLMATQSISLVRTLTNLEKVSKILKAATGGIVDI